MVTNTPGTAIAIRSASSATMYDLIRDPIDFVYKLGDMIHQSGMFGCKNAAQGRVMAWECYARRQPPLMLAEQYHMIGGKLSMKADKMLAAFTDLGGKHRIVCRTPERVEIILIKDGVENTFAFTWEDALKEPLPYQGNEADIVAALANPKAKRPALKPKYATPRSRMQMLWARVVSDGVRATDSRANGGRYTPEELDDDAVDASFEVVADEQPAAEVANETVAEAVAVEVVEPETVATTIHDNEPCTAQQSGHIRDLFAALELGDKMEAVLKKGYNASAIRNLTHAQAVELIGKLEAKLAGKKSEAEAAANAATAAAESAKPVEHAPQYVDAICNPDQVEAIKTLLKEIEQTKPGTCRKFADKGIKISELSFATANQVIEKLKLKQVEAFFEMSLVKWVPVATAATESTASDPAKN